MQLLFTEEQQAIQRTFHEFAVRELIPGAAERDRSAQFPGQVVQRLAELDALGIALPSEYGGLGLSTITQLLAIEGLAYGDAALASIVTAHYLGAEALALYGTHDQKRSFLQPLARGEMIAGFALTEPDAGSDVGSIRTQAVAQGGEWILNGSKTFISNAREAGLLILFARTGEQPGLRGISAFLIPAGTTGVTFSAAQDKSGIRSAPTYTVYLDEVKIPASLQLGETGQGGLAALRVLNHARIDIAAMANGISMRALQLAMEFATRREQFGQAVRSFQAIQLLLGEMDAHLEASRMVTFRAAGMKDAGVDVRREAAIAKYVASETCFQVVDSALQVHGGMGYMRESEIERLYRDCRVLRLYEGTSQIQLLTIARVLATRYDMRGTIA